MARAYVPLVNRTGEVTSEIPPIPIPSLAQMAEDFEELKGRFEEALDLKADPNLRLQYGPQGDKLSEEIEREFASRMPERVKLAQLLIQFKALVNELLMVDVLHPSKGDFDQRVDEARFLVHEKTRVDQKAREYLPMLEAVQEQGERAYTRKDKNQWARVNVDLEQLLSALQRLGQGGGHDSTPPEVLAPQFQLYLSKQIRELSETAQRKGITEHRISIAGTQTTIAQALQTLKRKVERVDVSTRPVDAVNEFRKLYVAEFQPLEAFITGRTATEGDGRLDELLRK